MGTSCKTPCLLLTPCLCCTRSSGSQRREGRCRCGSFSKHPFLNSTGVVCLQQRPWRLAPLVVRLLPTRPRSEKEKRAVSDWLLPHSVFCSCSYTKSKELGQNKP